ncbi:MAG: hypothetical protein AAB731_02385, partial [Patescibacteria group bacterium]
EVSTALGETLPRQILWQFTRNVDNPKKQEGFILMMHGRDDRIALFTEVDPTTLTALNRNDDLEDFYVGLDRLAKEVLLAIRNAENLAAKHGKMLCQRITEEEDGLFRSEFSDLGLTQAINKQWKKQQITNPSRRRGAIDPENLDQNYGYIADETGEQWFFHFDEARDGGMQMALKNRAKRNALPKLKVTFLPAQHDNRPKHLPPLRRTGNVALAVLPA